MVGFFLRRDERRKQNLPRPGGLQELHREGCRGDRQQQEHGHAGPHPRAGLLPCDVPLRLPAGHLQGLQGDGLLRVRGLVQVPARQGGLQVRMAAGEGVGGEGEAEAGAKVRGDHDGRRGEGRGRGGGRRPTLRVPHLQTSLQVPGCYEVSVRRAERGRDAPSRS